MEANNQETKAPLTSAVSAKFSDAKEYAKNTLDSVAGTVGVDSKGVVGRTTEEGAVTKSIESVTSKVPSGAFLGLACASIGASAALHLLGRKSDAQFIGQWVPTILIMGLYNKIVKLEGSE